jgi:hypothetical protein
MTPDVEAGIVVALRNLLDSTGLGHVKIVGYEVRPSAQLSRVNSHACLLYSSVA